MEKAFIISNNPAVWQSYRQARQVKGSLQEVFVDARNFIHQGSKLLNHPLAGSIKPNETPFKSLILTQERGTLDYQSLSMIESAMEILNKMPVLARSWNNSVIEDFAMIDLNLLQSAIDALPNTIYFEK
ncbi:GrdX family protein [Dehalobacterium formicoaceticum]|uniref:GrdX family protein n=1 Tax=Dehalobacterium formicoaceticum TaxID=51515 RepID=A0ABT1Y6M0_9FIRM|nr:GrdX family protein [Dehalobacterium formicoaceticum]MCR6546106.1 GrdX family protein [Dehalobacterium formicoaceticum]